MCLRTWVGMTQKWLEDWCWLRHVASPFWVYFGSSRLLIFSYQLWNRSIISYNFPLLPRISMWGFPKIHRVPQILQVIRPWNIEINGWLGIPHLYPCVKKPPCLVSCMLLCYKWWPHALPQCLCFLGRWRASLRFLRAKVRPSDVEIFDELPNFRNDINMLRKDEA